MTQETPNPKKPLKLKTALKAGIRRCSLLVCGENHNQTLRAPSPNP
jgi:hypothetical protein